MVGFGWLGSGPSDMTGRRLSSGSSGLEAAYLVPRVLLVVFLREIHWGKEAGDPLENTAGGYVHRELRRQY